jgi:hypothetical protein
MNLKELSEMTETKIKVLDARDGKVLCHAYKSNKHTDLSDRVVIRFWADMQVVKSVFGDYARPIICAYVPHKEVTNAT